MGWTDQGGVHLDTLSSLCESWFSGTGRRELRRICEGMTQAGVRNTCGHAPAVPDPGDDGRCGGVRVGLGQ